MSDKANDFKDSTGAVAAEQPPTNRSERVAALMFRFRYPFILLCALMLGFFSLQLGGLKINASFDEMIPQNHPYIQNYFDTRHEVGGLGNVIRVVVKNPSGDIFDPEFLALTQKVNDTLFLMPGVDRAWMKSIWMSSVRWTEVTEEGFRGGPVMPRDLDTGSLRRNIRVSGILGSLVGNDLSSIMYVVPLLEKDPHTGEAMDYSKLSEILEKQVREEFSQGGKAEIHIIGFAKLVGDLIDGMKQVFLFFLFAAAIAGVVVYLFVRCLRSTLLVLGCSVTAVICLLGSLILLGQELNPYTILVPFLVFAIGVSHGSQIMSGTIADVGAGFTPLTAARNSLGRLLMPGMGALLSDGIGFLVLLAIDIPVIGDLALCASIGVFFLIFTNLLLLPMLMSVIGVSNKAAERASQAQQRSSSNQLGGWALLTRFTSRRYATGALVVSLILLAGGFYIRQDMQIGDLDEGAPELRADSRYNRDIGFVNRNYNLTNDQFVVMVKTPEQQCSSYEAMQVVDNLAWELSKIPQVQSVSTLSTNVASLIGGLQEANPKWNALPNHQGLLETATQFLITDFPEMVNTACSFIPVYVYLTDHKAATLDGIIQSVETFSAANETGDIEILLASGPAGIEAVTNIVVERSSLEMFIYIYLAVAAICLLVLRSWRAVLVAIIPLFITSILAEALMVLLGIGTKVATLPVVALGVGIGVDYALYLLAVQLVHMRNGLPLSEAYARALGDTGKVVALVGITLSVGVVTWAFSAIKFQADMGILLAFMFLFNMLGALVMVPTLSYFLMRDPARDLPAGPAAGGRHGTVTPAAERRRESRAEDSEPVHLS
ncbi:RND family transporter [Halopseudomonas bauzanensis]|uniref:RND family transporter n=2 Tax=Halopseudomonas bauzanensis TaxID=653930 RepID=A0A4U0YT36_9GAMM|nr:RND family transporter [Halopseudomonas bauzanensis]